MKRKRRYGSDGLEETHNCSRGLTESNHAPTKSFKRSEVHCVQGKACTHFYTMDGGSKIPSQDRYRYKEGSYDLDLTYITDDIIGKLKLVSQLMSLLLSSLPCVSAMGFPATGIESTWRNHIEGS